MVPYFEDPICCASRRHHCNPFAPTVTVVVCFVYRVGTFLFLPNRRCQGHIIIYAFDRIKGSSVIVPHWLWWWWWPSPRRRSGKSVGCFWSFWSDNERGRLWGSSLSPRCCSFQWGRNNNNNIAIRSNTVSWCSTVAQTDRAGSFGKYPHCDYG